jgi:hypothetical protein
MTSVWELQRVSSLEEGFLVGHYTLARLTEFFESSDLFLVAEGLQGLTGFCIAQTWETSSLPMQVDLSGAMVVWVRLLCKNKIDGGNASALLYWELEQRTPHTLVANIVQDPPNAKSRRFHEGMGFTQVGTWINRKGAEPGDDRPREVWVKRR